MTVAAATPDTAEGAVVIAAGVAADILNEAAGAIRNITWASLSESNDISVDSICASVVAVAATVQDTAEGTMVAAAGVAAKILSEAAGAIRNITCELLSDSNDISADSKCAAAR